MKINNGCMTDRDKLNRCYCVLIIAAVLGAMIVISLIPTFTQRNTVASQNQLTNPFLVTYWTNMINGSTRTVTNANTLTKMLVGAVHIPHITGLTAQFISLYSNRTISEGRQTRTNEDRNFQGDLLNMKFTVRYLSTCGSEQCRRRAVDRAYFHLSTLYSIFNLDINFNDGRRSTVKLSFCAFNSTEICQINTGTLPSDCLDDDRTCANYNPICSSENGLCRDDCSDVEDMCDDDDEVCQQNNIDVC